MWLIFLLNLRPSKIILTITKHPSHCGKLCTLKKITKCLQVQYFSLIHLEWQCLWMKNWYLILEDPLHYNTTGAQSQLHLTLRIHETLLHVTHFKTLWPRERKWLPRQKPSSIIVYCQPNVRKVLLSKDRNSP